MKLPPATLPVPEVGRIDVGHAARITGFALTDIPVLIRARLLRPLGNPGPTAPRFFSAVEIRELAASRDWLDKAQRAVSLHNRRRNSGRSSGSSHVGAESNGSVIKTNNLGVRPTFSHSSDA